MAVLCAERGARGEAGSEDDASKEIALGLTRRGWRSSAKAWHGEDREGSGSQARARRVKSRHLAGLPRAPESASEKAKANCAAIGSMRLINGLFTTNEPFVGLIKFAEAAVKRSAVLPRAPFQRHQLEVRHIRDSMSSA